MATYRMTRLPLQAVVAACLAAATAACATSRSAVELAPGTGVLTSSGRPEALATAGNRYVVTEADVNFMAGMIPHHAQALRMARLAPTNAASREILLLCERILVSQGDEIELMRSWLADHGQRVPPADATHHRMMHDGVEHDMLMPGMLSEDEMAQLARARGVEFDRMFLTFMIRHHEGAISMVDELLASAGAAHDDFVYKFASDVWADQTAEIERMEKMLAALASGGGR